MSLQPLRAAAFALGILASAPAGADASTLKWPLPLPAGHPWRIVDLREGNGIRHEEYVPRGQGSEDYRDRILVQRMPSQDLGAEAYLTHVSAGLRTHCRQFASSGLFPSEHDGLPSAVQTLYCARFASRDYGYVVAQKAILDGKHLFVIEREWRLPAFSIDAAGMPTLDASAPDQDQDIKKEIRLAVRWLVEQVRPGAEAIAPAPPAAPAKAAPAAARRRS